MSDDEPATMDRDVPVVSFFGGRTDMAHWLPKLREIDVPVPESHPVPLAHDDDGPPEWETQVAIDVVERLGGEAFARSGYKSAQMNLEEGGHIRSADESAVDSTLLELGAQHAMRGMPMGESLWLREYLDVDFCRYCRENLVPEVRVFIRDGEIACHHPRLEGFDRAPDHHHDMALEFIESGWDGEHRDETIEMYAERVADAFGGWWSVDFVMDTTGTWWLTDMALDALYDLTQRGREGYSGLSEHPGGCPNDVETLADVGDADD